MNRDYQDFSERIDRYLRNELTAEEKIAFQIEMESNPELAEQVAVTEGVSKMLHKQKAVADFRTMQAEIEAELEEEATEPKPPLRSIPLPRFWLPAAAAVSALLLVAAGYLWLELKEVKTELAVLKEEFFEDDLEEDSFFEDEENADQIKNYRRQLWKLQKEYRSLANRMTAFEDSMRVQITPLANMSAMQSAQFAAIADQYLKPALTGVIDYAARQEGKEDSIFRQSLEWFNSGDYKDALVGFEKMQEDESLDGQELLFPMGVCYLSSDIDESISLLEQAFAQNRINREQWHLALAYLKKGSLDKSRKNLLEIITQTMDEEDVYRVSATQLLEKLKEEI